MQVRRQLGKERGSTFSYADSIRFLNGCDSGCLSAMRMLLERKREEKRGKKLGTGFRAQFTAVDGSNSFLLWLGAQTTGQFNTKQVEWKRVVRTRDSEGSLRDRSYLPSPPLPSPPPPSPPPSRRKSQPEEHPVNKWCIGGNEFEMRCKEERRRGKRRLNNGALQSLLRGRCKNDDLTNMAAKLRLPYLSHSCLLSDIPRRWWRDIG